MSAPLCEFARAARDVRPERMAAMSRLPVYFALEGFCGNVENLVWMVAASTPPAT
jgi:hypothetical protein